MATVYLAHDIKHDRKVALKVMRPELAEVLDTTYGVITYQEQVMRIASAMSGFTLNQADNLRKAMGKKKPQILARFKQQFVSLDKLSAVAATPCLLAELSAKRVA